ncbi:EamA family transporter [Thioclava sp. L04-15]|uniref:DMT family transporter n=1 Tax=Thioclava sp. L04-15 TaxID=1915318 RepID=UPI00099827B6|nr:DMT family transporter [Thioclava sp. L04-15]OOY26755.1 EamA family transporter [Thioclava sp. L04-15]TNE93743.1 MAG: DMT family transporter [Paracoccaceae bacterium]
MKQTPDPLSISPLAWALLGGLALIWGSSFLSNRAALEGAGVATVVFLRVLGGAVLLWIWVAVRNLPVPRDPRYLGRFLIMGLLNNAIPFSLIVWGQKHIDSGLASILNASTAIFGALIAALVFADERLSPRKMTGIAIGFAGVVVAIGPDALRGFDLTSAGQLAILGASLSYGFAGAYARFAIKGLRPEVSAAGMLTGGAIWTLPILLITEGMPSLDYAPSVWFAMLWLGFGCSALAYLLYYRILALAGAANLALVTLLIPPVAIVAGWAVYDERLGWAEGAGFALLALGLMILNRHPSKRVAPAKTP